MDKPNFDPPTQTDHEFIFISNYYEFVDINYDISFVCGPDYKKSFYKCKKCGVILIIEEEVEGFDDVFLCHGYYGHNGNTHGLSCLEMMIKDIIE